MARRRIEDTKRRTEAVRAAKAFVEKKSQAKIKWLQEEARRKAMRRQQFKTQREETKKQLGDVRFQVAQRRWEAAEQVRRHRCMLEDKILKKGENTNNRH